MRLSSCQWSPSSFEVNTWPSAVPRYSLLMLFGSAVREITVPPEGPTCRRFASAHSPCLRWQERPTPKICVSCACILPDATIGLQVVSLRKPPQNCACSKVQIADKLPLVLVLAARPEYLFGA